METILGKNKAKWIESFPLLQEMIELKEVFWTNPKLEPFDDAVRKVELNESDVKDAEDRLKRFSSYIKRVFPETESTGGGIIESPTTEIPSMKAWMEAYFEQSIKGNLFVKCDSHLAISGSIKARGGIYEVLKHAEDLATENNMLDVEDDYSKLDSDTFRAFYSQFSVAVGSTGNLGLSIGIMSAKLGFKVYVHMSADAKRWKKDLLRSKGVTVVEYDSDYSKAVEEGRKQSDADPKSYFVDDENSKKSFFRVCCCSFAFKDAV